MELWRQWVVASRRYNAVCLLQELPHFHFERLRRHNMVHSMHIIFLFFLQEVHQGFCMNACYSCISTKTEDCIRPDKNKIPLKHCDEEQLSVTERYAAEINTEMAQYFKVDVHHLDPMVPTNCIKQVTKVGGKEIVLRGCQLASSEELNICKKVLDFQKGELRTSYCSLCNGDGCNLANLTGPGKFFFLLVFAIFLLNL